MSSHASTTSSPERDHDLTYLENFRDRIDRQKSFPPRPFRRATYKPLAHWRGMRGVVAAMAQRPPCDENCDCHIPAAPQPAEPTSPISLTARIEALESRRRRPTSRLDAPTADETETVTKASASPSHKQARPSQSAKLRRPPIKIRRVGTKAPASETSNSIVRASSPSWPSTTASSQDKSDRLQRPFPKRLLAIRRVPKPSQPTSLPTEPAPSKLDSPVPTSSRTSRSAQPESTSSSLPPPPPTCSTCLSPSPARPPPPQLSNLPSSRESSPARSDCSWITFGPYDKWRATPPERGEDDEPSDHAWIRLDYDDLNEDERKLFPLPDKTPTAPAPAQQPTFIEQCLQQAKKIASDLLQLRRLIPTDYKVERELQDYRVAASHFAQEFDGETSSIFAKILCDRWEKLNNQHEEERTTPIGAWVRGVCTAIGDTTRRKFLQFTNYFCG